MATTDATTMPTTDVTADATADTTTDATSKRKQSTPPEDYTCSICNEQGHWIQQCTSSNKRKKKRKKKNPSHVHTPGVDPSQQDIDRARELQKIKPPNCFCGQLSRLKKVKKSNEGGEESRAIGNYFFFCSKGKFDDSKCRFARHVDDVTKSKKERICTFFKKTGFCKKGDKCMFSHDCVPVKTPKDNKKDNSRDSKKDNNKDKDESPLSEQKAETIVENVSAVKNNDSESTTSGSSSSSSSTSDSSSSSSSDSDDGDDSD
jgi:hypothetical protein